MFLKDKVYWIVLILLCIIILSIDERYDSIGRIHYFVIYLEYFAYYVQCVFKSANIYHFSLLFSPMKIRKCIDCRFSYLFSKRFFINSRKYSYRCWYALINTFVQYKWKCEMRIQFFFYQIKKSLWSRVDKLITNILPLKNEFISVLFRLYLKYNLICSRP